MEAKILLKQGKSIRRIAKELDLSRNTVRKIVREQEQRVLRTAKGSKLDSYQDDLRTRLQQASPHF